MNFDFYNDYKDYTNTELLKIVQRPDQYQEEAVNAASKRLNERNVSETDIDEAKTYYDELEINAKLRSDKINSYKEKTSDFFEPILNPTTEVKPGNG